MITWLKNQLTEKRRLRDELALAHHNLQKMREEYHEELRMLNESRAEHNTSRVLLAKERDAQADEIAHLKEQQASDVEFIRRLRGRRNVAWTRPPKRVPKNEVCRAFAVAPDAPLWVALNQELDDAIASAVETVEREPSAVITTELRTHVAGGLNELRSFQKRLLDLHAAASQADADLDGEGGENA